MPRPSRANPASILGMLVLVSLLGTGAVSAQMTNDPFGSLVINGIDGTAPNHVFCDQGTALSIAVSGQPNRPFILGFAPGIAVNTSVFAPGIALDIGPQAAVQVVMNGLHPSSENLLNLFGNTGPSGTQTLSLVVPAGAPTGLLGAFQAFIIDFTSPLIVAATAAADVTISQPFVYGSVSATALNPSTLGAQILDVPQGGQPTPAPAPLDDLAVKDIGLSGFGEFHVNDSVGITALPFGPPLPDLGAIDRHRLPTFDSARFLRREGGSPCVRTMYGDVRHVVFAGNNTEGFMIGDGVAPARVIGGSQVGANNGLAWRPRVAVLGNLMAAVRHVVSSVDQIFLFRLDGSVFPNTGTEAVNVTPIGLTSEIDDISLVFYGDRIFFVGVDSVGSPIFSSLFAAPTTGLAAATLVPLPDVNTGVPATFVGPELRSENGRLLARLKGTGSTAQSRLASVTATSSSISLSLVTAMLPVRTMPSLGRASDGTTNRVAVSPSGLRIAFVMNASTSPSSSEFLQLGQPQGGGIVNVSASNFFVSAIDTFRDPVWIDDDSVLFWAGISETQMDLYRYRISTAALLNITKTNGQTGGVLPITATTPSAIDPAGQFVYSNRLIFARRGLATAGTASGQNVTNLVGVPFPTLTPYNITGDEFPGIGSLNTKGNIDDFDIAYCEDSDLIWFKAAAIGQADPRVLFFDPGVSSPAEGFGIGAAMDSVHEITPSRDGSVCRFAHDLISTPNGPKTGVLEVSIQTPSVGTVILDDLTGLKFRNLTNLPIGASAEGFAYTKTTGGIIPQSAIFAFNPATQQSTSILPFGIIGEILRVALP